MYQLTVASIVSSCGDVVQPSSRFAFAVLYVHHWPAYRGGKREAWREGLDAMANTGNYTDVTPWGGHGSPTPPEAEAAGEVGS